MPTDYQKMTTARLREVCRKMSTARLEAKMTKGSTARERAMATQEYGRRLDQKVEVLLAPAPKPTEFEVNIHIQKLVDGAAADLSKVLTRVVTEALSQIKTPRP